MNDSNLIPNSARTPKERRENARKAGKASGAARKRRKTLRQVFETLLAGKVQCADTGQMISGAEAMGVAIFQKAAAGNVRAFQLIAEMTGEYKQAIEVEQKPVTTRKGMSRQEARAMLAELAEIEKNI